LGRKDRHRIVAAIGLLPDGDVKRLQGPDRLWTPTNSLQSTRPERSLLPALGCQRPIQSSGSSVSWTICSGSTARGDREEADGSSHRRGADHGDGGADPGGHRFDHRGADRRKCQAHRLAGAVCCGITGLLVSPISWTHHWVWAVPLLILLTVAAWRRRSWWIGLAAVLTFIVFSAAAALPSIWGPFGIGSILSANAYVCCGAVVLVATAFSLHQEGAESRRSRPSGSRPASGAIRKPAK
jgi:hypothetical protein